MKNVSTIHNTELSIPLQNKLDKLRLTRQDLISHGCKNCVWKMHYMCPHGLNGNDFLDGGICTEFIDFLLSLVHDDDSVNVLWENYNLYVLRLQSLDDYKAFKDMSNELDRLRNEGASEAQLNDLEAKRNTYKLWWSKLNDTVLRSIGRVVDREKRQEADSKPRMTVQQLNVLINDSADKLLKYEKGEE
jgi:hypothetical protein